MKSLISQGTFNFSVDGQWSTSYWSCNMLGSYSIIMRSSLQSYITTSIVSKLNRQPSLQSLAWNENFCVAPQDLVQHAMISVACLQLKSKLEIVLLEQVHWFLHAVSLQLHARLYYAVICWSMSRAFSSLALQLCMHSMHAYSIVLCLSMLKADG